MLPRSKGYDCAIPRPLSSRQICRVEAMVLGPAEPAAELTAPLMRQACVLYSTAATHQVHDGMHPVPVAFSSQSAASFVVGLLDTPVKVHVSGADVSLFDMQVGCRSERCTLATAPAHWQDFVKSNWAAVPGRDRRSSADLGATACLDFQEMALCVGATVTLVGELHRDAEGTISLVPHRPDEPGTPKGARSPSRAGRDRLSRTSWERGGLEESLSDAGERRAELEASLRVERVMVSDDPKLLAPAECPAVAPGLSNASMSF